MRRFRHTWSSSALKTRGFSRKSPRYGAIAPCFLTETRNQCAVLCHAAEEAGRMLSCARAVCANFAGKRDTAGEGNKKSPERRWAVRGIRVESGLFQAVGLGTEAVDLGFVGRDDDVDIANVAEIGAEHHVETVALAVG